MNPPIKGVIMRNLKTLKSIVNPFDEKYEVVESYFNSIKKCLSDAQAYNPRLSVVRFDIHYPNNNAVQPSDRDIRRFINSLAAQLKCSYSFKQHGKEQYLEYIWVKEFGKQSNKFHYHFCLLLNKDDFGFVGSTEPNNGKKTLAYFICEAWARTLGVDRKIAKRGVYLGRRPIHWLSKKQPDYEIEYNNVLKRLAYMAKPRDKVRNGIKGKSFSKGRYSIYTPKRKKWNADLL